MASVERRERVDASLVVPRSPTAFDGAILRTANGRGPSSGAPTRTGSGALFRQSWCAASTSILRPARSTSRSTHDPGLRQRPSRAATQAVELRLRLHAFPALGARQFAGGQTVDHPGMVEEPHWLGADVSESHLRQVSTISAHGLTRTLGATRSAWLGVVRPMGWRAATSRRQGPQTMRTLDPAAPACWPGVHHGGQARPVPLTPRQRQQPASSAAGARAHAPHHDPADRRPGCRSRGGRTPCWDRSSSCGFHAARRLAIASARRPTFRTTGGWTHLQGVAHAGPTSPTQVLAEPRGRHSRRSCEHASVPRP